MEKSELFFVGALVVALLIAGVYFAFFASQQKDLPSAGGPELQAGKIENQVGDNVAGKEIVVLETSKGTIEVELDRQKAPVTVKNFLAYANAGFYDGLVFHRVIPNFMIQGGGFSPNAVEKDNNAPIKLEADNGLTNDEGTVAMARTNDPDSATSQFFVNLKNNDFLNSAPGNDGYAVFGKVVKGMEVVKAIGGVRTATRGQYDDWPVENIVITKAYLKK